MDLLKYIDDNQISAGKAGAIEVLLEVLKTHMNDGNVCYRGCCALEKITVNSKYDGKCY